MGQEEIFPSFLSSFFYFYFYLYISYAVGGLDINIGSPDQHSSKAVK